MSAAEWGFVSFTVQMAFLSLLLVVPFGLLAAWWLARGHSAGKLLLETMIMLPLVLPPVVTGLLLLKLLGRRGWLGGWLYEQFDIEVVFTWRAVVIALAVMSLPLFVRSARAAIESVNPAFEQMARTLGAGEFRVFFTITLPLARRGVIAGAILALARALGEFGATILVAGNIPGQTTTVPVAIYQHVQAGEDARALVLAAISATLAFVALGASEYLLRNQKR